MHKYAFFDFSFAVICLHLCVIVGHAPAVLKLTFLESLFDRVYLDASHCTNNQTNKTCHRQVKILLNGLSSLTPSFAKWTAIFDHCGRRSSIVLANFTKNDEVASLDLKSSKTRDRFVFWVVLECLILPSVFGFGINK